MRKFEYLFIFLFIGLTIVLLLVPRRILYKPADKRLPAKRRLSYIQVVMLISSIISLAVIMLVKFIIDK